MLKMRSPFLAGVLASFVMVLAVQNVRASALPEARQDGTRQFRGKIVEPANISAIARRGKFLVIGSDEGAKIQVLERVDQGVYEAHPAFPNRSSRGRRTGEPLRLNPTLS